MVVYDLYSAYAERYRIVAGQREEQHGLHQGVTTDAAWEYKVPTYREASALLSEL